MRMGIRDRQFPFALALATSVGVAACSGGQSGVNEADPEITQRLQSEVDTAVAQDALKAGKYRTVRPVLSCVEQIAPNKFKAHWGYENKSKDSVSIPVGLFNRFWAPPINQGQPTKFLPGLHEDVAQVTFSSHSVSAWVIGTNFDLASKKSKKCAGNGGAGTGGATATGGTCPTGGAGTGGAATGGSSTGGSSTGGSSTGGSSTGGSSTGGSSTGGSSTGGSSTGGSSTGGSSTGGSSTGGSSTGGSSTGGSSTGGSSTGGSSTGGSSTGGSSTGGSSTGGSSTGGSSTGGSSTGGSSTGGSSTGGSSTGGAASGGSGTGGTPVLTCTPANCDDQNPCTADSCNTATGVCAHTPTADGTTCSDGNSCTKGDQCLSGVCTAGAPLICGEPDQCHAAGVCDQATGTCTNPTAPAGTTCNDGNACTTNDSCQAGACIGGTPKTCAASGVCHVAGVCNTTTGTCSDPIADDGTTCDDGNLCTAGDSCRAGSCSAGAPKVCAASGVCHVAGTCSPTTGLCSDPAAPNGSSCDDSNACSVGDACQNGSCAAGAPKVCPAPVTCHVAGACSATTGLCADLLAADGTVCSTSTMMSTPDGTCRAGSCVANGPVVTACDLCTFGPADPRCLATDEGCANCDPEIAGCAGFTLPADKKACEDVYSCFITNGCTVAGDPTVCWCGTNLVSCATSNAPPTKANGPCVDLVQAAVRLTTYDAATINLKLIDPATPLGRAVNLSTCRASFCGPECGVK